MYPHERSLGKKLAGQPFVMLGVNTDTKTKLRRAMKREQFPWRSWSDGDKDGPITTRWKIEAFPTIFLIDHKGVIRHRFVEEAEPKKIETAVEALLKEVPGESKSAE